MTKEREALKLVLEALMEHGTAYLGHSKEYQQAITKGKEALAQPEQEPLEYWNAVEGWVKIDEVRKHFDSVGCGTIYKTAGEGRAPLYTSPPKREWVGLTDVQHEEIMEWLGHDVSSQTFYAIEAKLKEKNT